MSGAATRRWALSRPGSSGWHPGERGARGRGPVLATSSTKTGLHLLWRWVRIGTWILIFTFPMQRTVSIGPVGALSKSVGFLAVPLAVGAVLATGRRRRLRDFEQATLWFAGIVVLSMTWTIDIDLTIPLAGSMVQLAALVLLVRQVAADRDDVRFLSGAFVAGAWVPVLQSIYGGLTDAQLVDGRLRVGEMHPNDLAFTLVLAMPLAWWLAAQTSERSNLSSGYRRAVVLSCTAFLPAAIYAIVLSGSRSALLLAAIALAPVGWTLVANRPRRAFFILLAAIAVAPLAYGLLPSAQTERLSTTSSEISDGTLNNRTTLWDAAFETFGEHVWTGVGAGASRIELGRLTGLELGAHNTTLSVASELGLIGLVPFLLCWLIACRRALFSAGSSRLVASTLCVVLTIGLQVRHWEYEKPTWLILALLSTMAVAPRNTDEE